MPDRYGPYRNVRYILEIDGIAIAGFSSCSIPENSTEPIEYREGTDPPTVRKLWSLNSYGNLTLEKGTTQDSLALFEWRKSVEQGQVDSARRNIAVILLDEEGGTGPRWEFKNAWIINYDGPDLDSTGNEVAIESLEIAHEEMERVA
ncbi:phage tail protein [Haloarcula sp. CBA1130]|uniref:phage tail protein n=1 Tax=unclassified Haloarcula TaxID=2624677 RepID=UPI0012467998|nr:MULTISPECIES: phage tail protein [unclassified Haloarcula]KAA9396519.1 phage tail protein [Haloarcula sp. CBA1130]KAA9397624.1 phage tail protein [Haloarcula sp. CBA1129]